MPTLERRVLPGLDEEVSAIGAGCWTIGGPAANNGVPIGWDDVDPHEAFTALLKAHELGVTFYDTADVYGLGRSERLLGRLVREVGRDGLVISSKVGYFAGTGPHAYHPDQMRHQLNTTLANLSTDRLDVYFFHSNDFGDDDRYLAEAIKLMRGWQADGIIGAIGMRAPHVFAQQWAAGDGRHSAESARFLKLFKEIAPDVVQARFNLLSPLYGPDETDIFAFARLQGVGVLIKQALGKGVLLGRRRRSYSPDARSPRLPAAGHGEQDPRSLDPRRHRGRFRSRRRRGDVRRVRVQGRSRRPDPRRRLAYLDQFIAELDIELGEQINRGYPHILLGRQR